MARKQGAQRNVCVEGGGGSGLVQQGGGAVIALCYASPRLPPACPVPNTRCRCPLCGVVVCLHAGCIDEWLVRVSGQVGLL